MDVGSQYIAQVKGAPLSLPSLREEDSSLPLPPIVIADIDMASPSLSSPSPLLPLPPPSSLPSSLIVAAIVACIAAAVALGGHPFFRHKPTHWGLLFLLLPRHRPSSSIIVAAMAPCLPLFPFPAAT